MKLTLQEATDMYESLSSADQYAVKQILHSVRHRYIMSGIKVDVPYFFFSIHRPMFQEGEEKEFLEIKEAKEFAMYAIYYIARFIKKARTGTTDET